MGLDLRTPGSRPEPKVNAQPLSHSGAPCTSLHGYIVSFLLGIHLDTELLGHTTTPCLIVSETARLFQSSCTLHSHQQRVGVSNDHWGLRVFHTFHSTPPIPASHPFFPGRNRDPHTESLSLFIIKPPIQTWEPSLSKQSRITTSEAHRHLGAPSWLM